MVKRAWWAPPIEAIGIALILLALVGFLCATSGCSSGVRVTLAAYPPSLTVQVGGEGLVPRTPDAPSVPAETLEPLPPPVGGVPLGPEAAPESSEEDGNARLPPPPRAGTGGPPRVDLK